MVQEAAFLERGAKELATVEVNIALLRRDILLRERPFK